VKRRKKAVKIRKKWAINPEVRVEESGKVYNRQKEKRVK